MAVAVRISVVYLRPVIFRSGPPFAPSLLRSFAPSLLRSFAPSLLRAFVPSCEYFSLRMARSTLKSLALSKSRTAIFSHEGTKPRSWPGTCQSAAAERARLVKRLAQGDTHVFSNASAPRARLRVHTPRRRPSRCPGKNLAENPSNILQGRVVVCRTQPASLYCDLFSYCRRHRSPPLHRLCLCRRRNEGRPR